MVDRYLSLKSSELIYKTLRKIMPSLFSAILKQFLHVRSKVKSVVVVVVVL